MKILLDENLPHKLRLEVVGHDVFTVDYMGWSGVENGELLKRAIDENFDVFISNDRGLQYEQNLAGLPIAVVVLLPLINTVEAIRPLIPKLDAALLRIKPGQILKVSPT